MPGPIVVIVPDTIPCSEKPGTATQDVLSPDVTSARPPASDCVLADPVKKWILSEFRQTIEFLNENVGSRGIRGPALGDGIPDDVGNISRRGEQFPIMARIIHGTAAMCPDLPVRTLPERDHQRDLTPTTQKAERFHPVKLPLINRNSA